MSPRKAGWSCADSPAAEVTLAPGAMPSCRLGAGAVTGPQRVHRSSRHQTQQQQQKCEWGLACCWQSLSKPEVAPQISA